MNRHFFKAIYLFILASCCFSLSGHIVTIEKLSQAEPILCSLDQQALVLFDVDYTLVIPEDAIRRPAGRHLTKKLFSEIVEKSPDRRFSIEYLYSKILSQGDVSLVDPQAPMVIDNLQQQGARTIAFTAAMAGSFGVIESLEVRRIEELKQFGLDFTSAFPEFQKFTLSKQSQKKYYPTFQSGVLFASNHSKGAVLKEFLITVDWYPRIVVFFDDRIDFLESAERYLQELSQERSVDIEFIGFHYTASETLPCNLDAAIAEFQFRYLVEQGEWLSDEQARQMLEPVQNL